MELHLILIFKQGFIVTYYSTDRALTFKKSYHFADSSAVTNTEKETHTHARAHTHTQTDEQMQTHRRTVPRQGQDDPWTLCVRIWTFQ